MSIQKVPGDRALLGIILMVVVIEYNIKQIFGPTPVFVAIATFLR
jgi:hypothetical protein